MALSRAGARHRRALVLVAGLALVGSAAAGCQSNPEPPPLDRTATSTSPTPSPTASAPSLPPEAKGTSEAAAKAFVRHYVATINYAMATGHTSELRELSDVDCISCSEVADNIEKLYLSGGHLEGKGWRVTAIDVIGASERGGPIVQVGVLVSPQRRFSRESANPRGYEGGLQSMTFFVSRTSSSWIVERWSQSS